VPTDGFGWAVLMALVDAVEGYGTTQDAVPAGNGTSTPVALISMDKYLPGQRPPETVGGGPGQTIPAGL
jgi:serine/threonine-protein kinase RsbW